MTPSAEASICVRVREGVCMQMRSHTRASRAEGRGGGESLSEAHSALGSSANEISQ